MIKVTWYRAEDRLFVAVPASMTDDEMSVLRLALETVGFGNRILVYNEADVSLEVIA